MNKRNIIGVAYSQRRYSNANVILDASAYERVPVNAKQFLVSVIATSVQGGPYGRVEVEVVSTPTVSTNTQHVASAHQGTEEKGATNVFDNAAYEGFPAGTPSYPSGTVLKLKAITNSNGKFVGWADGVAAATRTVTVTGNAQYVARFISAVQIQNLRLYCLDSRGRIQGNGLTEETANNVGVLTRVYTADVEKGDSITFKAVAKEGYRFVRWNVRTGNAVVSGVNLSSPSLTLRMNGSASLEALFEVIQPDPTDNPGGGPTDNPPYDGHDDPPYGGNEPADDDTPTPGSDSGNNQGNDMPGTVLPSGGIVETAKPFVKKWWWAILIVAYVVYKEWKGGSK